MTMKPKIYLETTVFNYYFLKDPRRAREISFTRRLFEQIREGKFEPFVSDIVIDELNKCADLSRREKMFGLIEKFRVEMLSFQDYPGVEQLSNKYILAGAIPSAKKPDALHIAVATLGEVDILVSWNCDHIVKFKTQQIVKAINLAESLNDIAINTPEEVI